jgi:heme A synthase
MSGDTLRIGRFALFAWAVLAYNLLVILWGAVVRATGSGAGCGEHWPLCEGVVIPHQAQIATLIEYAHRASSAVALLLVIGLVFFAFRRFGAGHPTRAYAVAALCFTLTEATIGAALVLFGWTGSNTSTARFVVLSIHLANTFMLLASLALTARAASRSLPGSDSELAGLPEMHAAAGLKPKLLYALALLGTLALAITGTVAALADTLFPSASLAQGLSRDFSATSSYLLRLRVVHPALAVVVGALLLTLAARVWSAPATPETRRAAGWLFGLVILQAALGLLTLALLAPVLVQVLHLLVADLVWIALVLLTAEALGMRPTPAGWVARSRSGSRSTAPSTASV